MKILWLGFKNLNSLYGQWEIDFTRPDFTQNGLFALTGPTGAGKSTILDAICLGLYGATPRLGRITRTSNEIMSRQTGECWAEVLFESQAGRFRCHWYQRRARKKPDANLVDARHEISDSESGRPIETKKSRVPGIVEAKTGMDLERFTRSVLLAQGGFDSFLKAGVEEKSRILEQITGTGIYTQISKRVHEELKHRQSELDLLRAQISGVVLMSSEQKALARTRLAHQKDQAAAHSKKMEQTAGTLAWLDELAALEKQRQNLASESDRLDREAAAFEPEARRLALGLKAAGLAGEHAGLSALKNQLKADEAELAAENRVLPDLAARVKARTGAQQTAMEKSAAAVQSLEKARPLLGQVRLLDQAVAEKQKQHSLARKDSAGTQKQIDTETSAMQALIKQRDAAEQDLEKTRAYLSAHAGDKALESALPAIEQQLSALVLKTKEVSRAAAERKKTDSEMKQAKRRVSESIEQLEEGRKAMAGISQVLETRNQALKSLLNGSLLREYQAQKENLLHQMILHARIAELETQRADLADGNPCPLCGSLDHPFARGNVPVPDEIEKRIEALTRIIRKAQALETEIRQLNQDREKAGKALSDLEKALALEQSRQAALNDRLNDMGRRIETIKAQSLDLEQAAGRRLAPFGVDLPASPDVAQVTRALEKRQSTWQDHTSRADASQALIRNFTTRISQSESVIRTLGQALADKKAAVKSAQTRLDQAVVQRSALFEKKNPDQEEARLNQAVESARTEEKETAGQLDTARTELAAARTRAEALTSRIKAGRAGLEKRTAGFLALLEKAGFSSESEYEQARLSKPELDRLRAAQKDLDTRITRLTVRQKDHQERLASLKEKPATRRDRSEIVTRLTQLKSQQREMDQCIAALAHQLARNDRDQASIRQKQTAIQGLESQYRDWEVLHALIGSADGKKYRNFAQGLTFERMIGHANQQLEKMTDRYLLVRDSDLPLELNVVDAYQAGEVRSSRNLSGGESFIVSLALALGLSKMASQRVRVDSLFLDEGFGTLDDEALETALETLAGLHQDGKLIGVISHVSALKERIPTRIAVQPVSGGRSRIQGPGCRQVT